MIINTTYRMGSFVDLCPCCPNCNHSCGNWQTSCPCHQGCGGWQTPTPCFPSDFPQFCPPQPCEHSCNNFLNCCETNRNILFFLAGRMCNRNCR